MTLDAETDGAGDAWAKEAGFRVRKVPRKEAQDPDWPIEYRFGLASGDDEDTEELRVEVLRTSSATSGDAAIPRVRQGLSEHHAWTASAARRIAKELGLAPEHENVLVAAAAIHDAGKAREMWQNAMCAPRDGRPYAKTTGGGDFRALMMDGATYRHEFGFGARRRGGYGHLRTGRHVARPCAAPSCGAPRLRSAGYCTAPFRLPLRRWRSSARALSRCGFIASSGSGALGGSRGGRPSCALPIGPPRGRQTNEKGKADGAREHSGGFPQPGPGVRLPRLHGGDGDSARTVRGGVRVHRVGNHDLLHHRHEG